jgi:hypothetical protein
MIFFLLFTAVVISWQLEFKSQPPHIVYLVVLCVMAAMAMAYFLEKEKKDDVACQRLFLMAYNINNTIVELLKFPKARSDGEFFSVQFMAAAFDDRAKRGEFFLQFRQKVYCSRIQLAFEAAGARSVTRETFGGALSNHEAASALLRVWETAFNAGVELVLRGDCPDHLLQLTMKKWTASHPKLHPMMGSAPSAPIKQDPIASDAMGEFDVVKKRRIMDEYDGSDNDDDDSERLLQFEEFEDATMQALMEALDTDDKRTHEEDMLQFENAVIEAMVRGETIPMTGGVYIAKNASLDGILKVGATRRHPKHRLYELSRSTPTPFELVVFFPSMTPFNLEKMIHAYLAACRIRNQGAGTEFFRMTAAKIPAMTTTLNLPAPVFA